MHAKSNDRTLYTVLMEFVGTTSAAQIRAADAQEALTLWFAGLVEADHYGLSIKDANRLRESSGVSESPIPVQGLQNVWCTTVLSGDDLALFHVIRTGEDPDLPG